MIRILQQRHSRLTLYVTQHNEGAGDVFRAERLNGEQIARGSLDAVKAATRDWLVEQGHICSEECSGGWEELVKQWTHAYSDGKLGHIVARENGPYFLVIYPPNPPRVGSLPVDAAETLDDAIAAANTLAGGESRRQDWRGPAD